MVVVALLRRTVVDYFHFSSIMPPSLGQLRRHKPIDATISGVSRRLTPEREASIPATMSQTDQSKPKSVVAVYSGGMDSTVMLYDLLASGIQIKGAVTFDYGQKHRKEIEGAKEIADSLGLTHRVVDLTAITELFGHSGLTDPETEVPEGHYEEEQMKQTVVPNRNMILVSVATAWAISLEADAVAYAAHSGDHAIYPDCRESFAAALDQAIQLCDWSEVSLFRPFVNVSKKEIVEIGVKRNAPLEKTWSCYKGGQFHCGKCGTCIERREAFYLASVNDPTRYESSAPSVEELVAKNWHLS